MVAAQLTVYNYVPPAAAAAAAAAANESNKLWGGRFTGQVDPTMEAFNSSIAYDKVMWKEDIQVSVSYSSALARAEVITWDECQQIHLGLATVQEEWKSGTFNIQSSDEDIHTANERRLTELIGDVGRKVHTGRSRNDQVASDIRLWLMSHIKELTNHLKYLIQVLVSRAEQECDILMPGYTHLQRAQPIRWSHWLLSATKTISMKKFISNIVCSNMWPLAQGALAGNPFGVLKVDREILAKELGFSKVSNNSLQAVSDRDFVMEYLFWSSMTCLHLSRLAEDLIIFSSREFGFVQLADAYSTGSSLMPQKKNPDSLELIRGKAGRINGHLFGFMMVVKGLPSTYNKDLQEDKEPLFDTADTMTKLVTVATGTVASLKVHKKACESGLSEMMLSTDIAYYLVKKGMSFRTAHGKAGEVVKLAEDLSCNLSQIPLDKLQDVSQLFKDDVSSLWEYENSVEQYKATGGTAKGSVLQQISKAKEFIKNFDI
ncbi:unnamed protein product, partial [Meganyctiphanes norvegica]